ncbi:MAG: bacteriohemerythrin [Campylobacteraceae bacterium]|jgi:hemerythrin|nr:bacteriohemerythrin [Campylobacteraceae bacterium]
MAYWAWDSSYDIGIEEIDNQHKRIVQYINELHGALVLNDKDAVKDIFLNIADYTLSHFSFEEKLMREAGYHMFAEHKSTHEAFISTIGKYKFAFDAGRDITGQLMAELQIWLTHHILHEDKDYKECVQKMLFSK